MVRLGGEDPSSNFEDRTGQSGGFGLGGGGGSNLLLTKDFEGVVVKNEIAGIDVVMEEDDVIRLKVGSGENWHHFVMHCVAEGFGGIF